MLTVIIVGWSVRRSSNLLNSLAASGFVILIWEPSQLFQASFQLSFFVVLSIALLLPRFESLRQRLLQTDPFLPDELRPRWQRWLDWPVRAVTTSLATSLAAWFGSLPLIAYYFHLFTPASLLANLVVVPLSSLALMCNLGALVCGDWLPWINDAFNNSGWLFMRGMIRFSEWTIKLPGAFLYVRTPTTFEFFAFYTAMFLLVNGWLWIPGARRWSWAVLSVFACLWWVVAFRSREEFRLTVVGQGGNSFSAMRPATITTCWWIAVANPPRTSSQSRSSARRVSTCLQTSRSRTVTNGASAASDSSLPRSALRIPSPARPAPAHLSIATRSRNSLSIQRVEAQCPLTTNWLAGKSFTPPPRKIRPR